MIKVSVCLARLCPDIQGEIRTALQLSSENLLCHKVISWALQAVPSDAASDNVVYQEPEDGHIS